MTKRLYISAVILATFILACGLQAQNPQSAFEISPIPPVSAPAEIVGIVKTDVLEVRIIPAGNRIAYLYAGDVVTILGNLDRGTPDCLSGWYQIKGGFVCAEFIGQ